MTEITKIDQLPPAPLITDSEPEFASKASAFVNSLQAFREQANDLADDVEQAVAGALVLFDGYKGDWEPGEYDEGQIVRKDALFYISLVDNNTQEPPNNNWQFLLETPAENVTYDNEESKLSSTDVQSAIDEIINILAKGNIFPFNFGDFVFGGFFAGIIDTVKGIIDENDDYQTGLRYALIVSPKDFEGGHESSPASGLPTGDLRWDTAQGSGESGCFTRWNGLEATETILDKNNDSRYEVFGFIRELRSKYPVPSDGGSDWYLPALDELELIYRNLKPNAETNSTFTSTRNFPGLQDSGANPSSDPTGAEYTSNDPKRTTVTAFQEGNAESLDLGRYWTSTDADQDGRAWDQRFTVPFIEGGQGAIHKDNSTISFRPVRRILI